jgi:hypothetical protein
MAVELEYEQITGQPFDMSKFNMVSKSLDLCLAVIRTYNPSTEINIHRLKYEATGKEIGELNTAVAEALTAWMEIPATELANQPEAKEGDPKPKN